MWFKNRNFGLQLCGINTIERVKDEDYLYEMNKKIHWNIEKKPSKDPNKCIVSMYISKGREGFLSKVKI